MPRCRLVEHGSRIQRQHGMSDFLFIQPFKYIERETPRSRAEAVAGYTGCSKAALMQLQLHLLSSLPLENESRRCLSVISLFQLHSVIESILRLLNCTLHFSFAALVFVFTPKRRQTLLSADHKLLNSNAKRRIGEQLYAWNTRFLVRVCTYFILPGYRL